MVYPGGSGIRPSPGTAGGIDIVSLDRTLVRCRRRPETQRSPTGLVLARRPLGRLNRVPNVRGACAIHRPPAPRHVPPSDIRAYPPANGLGPTRAGRPPNSNTLRSIPIRASAERRRLPRGARAEQPGRRPLHSDFDPGSRRTRTAPKCLSPMPKRHSPTCVDSCSYPVIREHQGSNVPCSPPLTGF